MSHRALITGIPGFAGGFLAEHLLDCGDAVIGCSPDGHWEKGSPARVREGVELVAWDLRSEGGIPDEARGQIERFRPDWIFHLAAISVPDDCGSGQPSAEATAVNVDGTRRVMELAASLREHPRVVFASSSHVYAPVDPRAPRVDEDAPLGPKRGYGRTKLAAEREIGRAVGQQGCDVVIARSFQHTGPRQNARMMLPQWARQFARGGTEPVEVYTRDARIDLTDVRDVVRAYRLLAGQGQSGKVYNVGSGISRRTGDVLGVLQQMADLNRPVLEIRPGFKQDPIADVSRLVGLTQWRPQVPLE